MEIHSQLPISTDPPKRAHPEAQRDQSKTDGYSGSVARQEFDQKALRQAYGRFGTGVTVITTGEGEERRGMTASSFNTVSMDPPLVLFSAKNGSATLEGIKNSETFVINVLAEDQKDVCFAFAGKDQTGKFQTGQFEPGKMTGAPVLQDSLGHFECRLWKIVPGGDHEIVIGEVVGLERPETTKEPLMFYGGNVQNADGWKEKA